MRHFCMLMAGIVTMGLLAADARAIEIDGYVSAENDRFANDPSFIMHQYDLSGVALSSDGRWATLVSRTVFASAYHFHPAADDTVTITFYETNDLTGPAVTRTVVSGQRVASSDIWLGELDTPVPVGYAVYDFATEDINNTTDFGNSIYNEVNSFMFGKTDTISGDGNVGVGRNVLDGWLEEVTVAGTTDDAMTADAETGPGARVEYEAVLESGDSGGPMFVDLNNDGNLTFVGTNWILTSTNQATSASGFAYLGNYDSQIPEPTTIVLLGLGGLAMIRRRRRV